MYFSFSSNFPAVVKLDGLYFGNIYLEPKTCNFDDNHTPFVEVCPLNNSGKMQNFFPDKEFLSCPPKDVLVTDLKGGYLITINTPPKTTDFKIITQEKSPYAVITIFSENGYKLSIETPYDFYAETFDYEVIDGKIKVITIDKKQFLLIELQVEKGLILNIYDVNNKTNKLFSQFCDSYSLDNGFTTCITLSDIAKHKVSTTWQYKENKILEKNRSVACLDTFDKDNLPDLVLPYAFLEGILAGENIGDYLCENILKNKDKLKNFLGEFIGVFPPPVFRSEKEVGLVYKKSDNVFYAEYFIFEVSNHKIINLKKV